MKKILMMAAVAIMTAMNVQTQTNLAGRTHYNANIIKLTRTK